MKELFLTAAKGAVIGGTMLIPGVSGGSMAMMMGIYDKLIMAVSNFRKDMKSTFSSCSGSASAQGWGC